MKQKPQTNATSSFKAYEFEEKRYELAPLIENSTIVKILLIDDFDVAHNILRRNLLKAAFSDFKIDQVASRKEALQRMHIAEYDLVLVNDMPGNAIAIEFLIPFIRGHFEDAPIVIISNDTDSQYLRNAEGLDADYVVRRADLAALMLRLIPLFKAKGLLI